MTSKSKTKSRTKSGSKNKKSKISNKLIAAIVVGVVAIAGIAIIFRSFAAGPTAYQYSFYTTCTADKKTTTVKSDLGSGNVTVGWDTKSDCLKDSAEEQAYRLNRAVTNEQPPRYPTNYERYKEYVQKLAGDRTPPPELVPQSFLDQFKNKSDAEFVNQVFKNVLYRSLPDGGASWAAEMKKNGWSRKDAVFIISSSPEAKTKNVGRFTEFLRNRPEPVAIKPNAQLTQDYRLKLINGKIEEMKILNYVILAGRNEINSMNSSAESAPKKEEVSKNMIKQADIKKQIDDLVRDAKVLTSTSPDISDAAIVSAQAKANELLNSSWAGAVEAGSRADTLKTQEEEAARRAQEEAARQAAEAQQQASAPTPTPTPSPSSGTSSGSGATPRKTVNSSGGVSSSIKCNLPVEQINQDSGNDCIRKLQKTYGISQDGIWGPETQKAKDLANQAKGARKSNGTSRGGGKDSCDRVPNGVYYRYEYNVTNWVLTKSYYIIKIMVTCRNGDVASTSPTKVRVNINKETYNSNKPLYQGKLRAIDGSGPWY